MSATPHVAGAALVKMDDYTGPGLRTLGYTREGAETENEPFFLDIPGDENGGDAGPPIEIQYLGEIARIRLELTKWDSAIYTLIESNVPTGTAGQPGSVTPGTLLLSGTKFYRICLAAATEPRNFPCCIPRGARTINKGTKFSTAVIEFECYKHPSTGSLWDASVV